MKFWPSHMHCFLWFFLFFFFLGTHIDSVGWEAEPWTRDKQLRHANCRGLQTLHDIWAAVHEETQSRCYKKHVSSFKVFKGSGFSVVILLTVINITGTTHWMFIVQYAVYLVSSTNNYIKLS